MAETLGSLCDKLTIVKLKQFHSKDTTRLESLNNQGEQLIDEINQFITDAFSGSISLKRLSFPANKVYKEESFITKSISGSLGQVFEELAQVNCDLWHEQEKVYEFETIPVIEKNTVVRKLAILNLERVKCIDEINNILTELCSR